MDHAITVGMIVWATLATLGCIAVIGVLVYILKVVADGFNH